MRESGFDSPWGCYGYRSVGLSEAERAYQREYQLARYHRRRAAAVAQLGGRCVRCGSTDDLDFDHVDPGTKRFTIAARLVSVTENVLQAELAKCQLLCRSCHVEKTRAEQRTRVHGTASMYRRGEDGVSGCRCGPCLEAAAVYHRRYMKGKKRRTCSVCRRRTYLVVGNPPVCDRCR